LKKITARKTTDTFIAMSVHGHAALAQQGGTEQEARAMLDKAITAVKADQVVAIIKFTKGEDGFLDRDLYPFCFRISDAKTLATPYRSSGPGLYDDLRCRAIACSFAGAARASRQTVHRSAAV
jgi:hypothetical protein